jgi:hypothetical protein
MIKPLVQCHGLCVGERRSHLLERLPTPQTENYQAVGAIAPTLHAERLDEFIQAFDGECGGFLSGSPGSKDSEDTVGEFGKRLGKVG